MGFTEVHTLRSFRSPSGEGGGPVPGGLEGDEVPSSAGTPPLETSAGELSRG